MTADTPTNHPQGTPRTDKCPGGAEYGHGMSLTTVHAGGCCERWDAEHAPKPSHTPRADALLESGKWTYQALFDLVRTLERALAALRSRSPVAGEGEREARLEGALREALPLLLLYKDEAGPCDHSVGICFCGIEHAIFRIRNVLGNLPEGGDDVDG